MSQGNFFLKTKAAANPTANPTMSNAIPTPATSPVRGRKEREGYKAKGGITTVVYRMHSLPSNLTKVIPNSDVTKVRSITYFAKAKSIPEDASAR